MYAVRVYINTRHSSSRHWLYDAYIHTYIAGLDCVVTGGHLTGSRTDAGWVLVPRKYVSMGRPRDSMSIEIQCRSLVQGPVVPAAYSAANRAPLPAVVVVGKKKGRHLGGASLVKNPAWSATVAAYKLLSARLNLAAST